MKMKSILMCAMVMGSACASAADTRELALGEEDGLPCKLTLVGIPGTETIHSFAMSKFEITQEQYEKVMGANPSTVKGARLPVNNVTWAEAMKFCDRMNSLVQRKNLKWTLPTCAQWFYAAKGGENFKYPGSDEIDTVAWTFENSKEDIRPVGGKKANGYGLCDMCGNVREWGRALANDAEWQPILGGAVFYRGAFDISGRGIGALTRNCRQPSNGFRVVVIDTQSIEHLIAVAEKTFADGLGEGKSKRILLDGQMCIDLIRVVDRDNDCYLGRYEITQAQYEKVMGTNPSGFRGGNLPVENVSWQEAMKFCDKLNDKLPVRGMRWTLPTVGLWRKAEQASGPSYHFVDSREVDDVAWYCSNAGGKTHPVGQRIPNGAGFFDMSGNVAEWCLDAGSLAGRVILGGGWNCVDASCSVGDCGSWMMPDQIDPGVGFRVCLIPESLFASQKSSLKNPAEFKIESKSVNLGKNVRITLNRIPAKDYWFAVSELTQAQYESITGKNPSEPKGIDLPVVNVSWRDALAFCELLNEKFPQKGQTWTLPTREQWNYAASGGQKFLFSGGGNIDDVGWFGGNSGGHIHPVCQKKPNAFGLYDMTGNAREFYIEARRERDMLFANPSCWNNSDLKLCMLEVARCFSPDGRSGNVGFRVILIPADSFDISNGSTIISSANRSVKNRTSIQSILDGMIKVPGKDFWLSETELTQGQWEAVMGNNPSRHKGANLPVECVSRDDCDVFLAKLNQTKEVRASRFEFYLPTLPEWMYAAQAGGSGTNCWIKQGVVGEVLDMAWVQENSGGETHAVATKAPNAFGFYDMLGNVWEWMYGEDQTIGCRHGFAFDDAAAECTVKSGWHKPRYMRFDHCGLRVAARVRPLGGGETCADAF